MARAAVTWPFFEHVRVINLDSRADRWAAMQAQFERLGVTGDIQRFAAVRPPADIGELPQLAGRVKAKAIRVPTHNVSAIDMVLTLARDIEPGEVNRLLREAAGGCYRGLIAYSDEAHASIDFNHDPHSAIVDGGQTHSIGPRMVNLLVWFDNEWGFASRMVDVTRHWLDIAGPAVADSN